AVGDHVEEVAHVSLSEPIDVKRRRLTLEPALNDHAVTAAGLVVARAAVDVVAVLASIHQGLVHWKRELLHGDLVDFAGEKRLVVLQRAARDRPFDQWPRTRPVGEERAGPEAAVLRLVVHVLSAGAEPHAQRQNKERALCRSRLATGVSRRGPIGATA